LTAARDDWRTWKFEDRETIQRSFTVPGGAKLVVDNISGFVHVTGYDGNKVEIDVKKEARAESQRALDESKQQVKLDIQQNGDTVKLYVDGPFRTANGSINYQGDERYGYHVNYDYEIRVPRSAQVDLRTINNGEIQVKQTTGDFTVKGLNGRIDMEGVSGSGSVHTLNGKVRVAFAHNPQRDCEFHTLNGAMDVYFQPPFDADLQFKTLNGGVYTDFPVTTLASTPGTADRRNGKFVYKSHGFSSARVGNGGPELTFDAFNGDIRILQAK